jgi:hypothetical protein
MTNPEPTLTLIFNANGYGDPEIAKAVGTSYWRENRLPTERELMLTLTSGNSGSVEFTSHRYTTETDKLVELAKKYGAKVRWISMGYYD